MNICLVCLQPVNIADEHLPRMSAASKHYWWTLALYLQPAARTSKPEVAYKLMTARNIQRPQLRFKEKIDNSYLPFKPLLRHKPHAIKSLEGNQSNVILFHRKTYEFGIYLCLWWYLICVHEWTCVLYSFSDKRFCSRHRKGKIITMS